MENVNLTRSVSTLNVNGLNISIKNRDCQTRFKKARCNCVIYKRHILHSNMKNKLKVKDGKGKP